MNGARILALTSGRRTPSARFRIAAYAHAAAAAGHRLIVRPSWPDLYTHNRLIGWRASQHARQWLRRRDLAAVAAADAVLIERQLFDDASTDLEDAVRDRARRLVYDVDDAIHLGREAKFAHLWSQADAVIAGNADLVAAVAPHQSRVHLIPTSLDTDRFSLGELRPPGEPVCLGWTGTTSNLPQLELVREAAARVHREHPLSLHVVCDATPDDHGRSPTQRLSDWPCPVRHTPWREAVEVSTLRTFDIGLMPLADSPWNRSKCGFKLLQYLAVGVPAIASPVGANVAIADGERAALLADSPSQWAAAIERLATASDRRRELREVGRRRVEEHYSIAAHAARWLAVVLGTEAPA